MAPWFPMLPEAAFQPLQAELLLYPESGNRVDLFPADNYRSSESLQTLVSVALSLRTVSRGFPFFC